MNCQKFEQVVSELARGQIMTAEQRGEAFAHSEGCEQCAARLRDEEMLTRGLQSLAAEMESLSAPEEVELKLLEAFRRPSVVVHVSSRQSSAWYWLAAVAAILLIAMGVVAVRWRSSSTDTPGPIVVKEIQKEAEVDNMPPDGPPKVDEHQIVDEAPKRQRKPPRPRLRRSEEPQIANHVSSEIATDFIPLRYMGAASLQEGGQIVRVELPRSALANFGLPVNMDRYNERVKADVLFGVDGLAHAIRFVQ